MGGYYKYQSVSYSTVGSNTDEAFGSFKTRPLVPHPNVSSEDYYDHNYDYDYVPKRTLVPIATRPYGDAYRHGSPTRAYPTRHDDEWHSPQKADEFLPKRTTVPVTTRPYGDEYNYIHGSPTKAYSPRDDDEWLRQTSPVRDRPQRADEFKRTTVPVATRPDYGGHEYKHGSPARREAYPARDDDKWHPQNQNSSVYGHPQKPKADELLTKKPLAPVATRPYGPEYERISPSTEAYPARDDQKWHRPQKPQPVISPDWRRSTANNGNYKPIDSSDDAYGRRYQQQPSEDKWNAMQKAPNGSNKAIINPGWSSSPRKGTPVSGPTNDIDTFVEMLKQATLEAEDKRGTKPTANSYAFPTPRTINSTEAEKKYKGARV